MPLDLRISLLTWSLIGLCLAIVVWLWVHPVWRDLEAMRQTARAFGEGLFEARAPAMRSSAFGPSGRNPERHGRTHPAADRHAEGVVQRDLARTADADRAPALRARDARRTDDRCRSASACGDDGSRPR
jgi:hypothetical protein